MPLDADVKAQIIAEFKRSENDTGSAEVQVALLTRRIKDLTQQLNSWLRIQQINQALK